MKIDDREKAHAPLKSNWLPLTGANNIELDRAAELRRVSFLAKYSNYAGSLFDRLRAITLAKGMQLPRTVSACQTALYREEMEGGGKNMKMVERCVQRLQEDGYDVDQSLARDAIVLYAHRNEVCHTAAGSKAIKIGSEKWHNLIDTDIENLGEPLPARYHHCHQNVLRLLHFYRGIHLSPKSTGQKKAIPAGKTQVPNLSGLTATQHERAFEDGEFREGPGTSSRPHANFDPLPKKRKAPDFPKGSPAKKQASDAYLRVLWNFNQEIEELCLRRTRRFISIVTHIS